MATTDFPSYSTSSSAFSSRRFPTWQSEYEAVLLLVKTFGSLHRCVEVAEMAIQIRRAALEHSSNHCGERQAIEEALANLNRIKRETLKFRGAPPVR